MRPGDSFTATIVRGVFALLAAAVSLVGPGPAVRCRLALTPTADARYAFSIKLDPPRSLRVLGGRDGDVVLIYLDRSTRRTNPSCRPVRARTFDVSGMAGPWPSTRRSVVACGDNRHQELTIEVASIRVRQRTVGTRLIAALGRTAAARVDLRTRGRGIWISPGGCFRPTT